MSLLLLLLLLLLVMVVVVVVLLLVAACCPRPLAQACQELRHQLGNARTRRSAADALRRLADAYCDAIGVSVSAAPTAFACVN